MGAPVRSGSKGTALVLVIGAAIGLVLGVIVSLTTDVPFAPEIGLLLGLFVGWLLRRRTSSSSN
jgi:hypothetical protein